jgi:hypothetical protein
MGRGDAAIATAIISIAKSLNLKVNLPPNTTSCFRGQLR